MFTPCSRHRYGDLSSQSLSTAREMAVGIRCTQAFSNRISISFLSPTMLPEFCDNRLSLAGTILHHGKLYYEQAGRFMCVQSGSEITAIAQLGQLTLLCKGTLKAMALPILRPMRRQLYYECGSRGKHNDSCLGFQGDLASLKRRILMDVIAVTRDWVVLFMPELFSGDEGYFTQESRLREWELLVDSNAIHTIFRAFSPGVDLKYLTSNPIWSNWARTSVGLLADWILRHELAGIEGEREAMDVLISQLKKTNWLDIEHGGIPVGGLIHI